ncbi:odorant receptor Or1-like [Chrysoperla carnea]|uniref:odorant receptor Or1-like n=1 Tax=Chrysoperla carnea TaxID=189513 RepID=UPI001D094A05|nr:odorant receptor Or1-like [Chrysoperla carnea]
MYSIFPFLDKKGDERKLPYRIWYPFDIHESLIRYILTYAYQTISVVNNAVHNAAIDTIISGLMVHICAQLALLQNEIENLKILINELMKLKATNHTKFTAKRIEFTSRCVHCIFHHRKIKELSIVLMKFLNETESIFTFGIFAQFSASILILCITALQLTIVAPFTFEFFAFITYLICMLSQIFLYCWYGNEIIHHSLSLPNTVYETNWYESDKNYKKYVEFLIFHTQRPLKLRVGRFFTLSLHTFMAILRNSYSYFAVLNQMQNN